MQLWLVVVVSLLFATDPVCAVVAQGRQRSTVQHQRRQQQEQRQQLLQQQQNRDSHSRNRQPNSQVVSAGSIVNARWQGDDQWYRGEIVLVHADGSVDIQFDDGDFESHVRANRMSMPDPAIQASLVVFDRNGLKLRKGIRVRAPWQGGHKMYPGKLILKH